jgi:hypothetical protein
VAHAAQGDVFIEIAGSEVVELDLTTREQGTATVGAAQDLRLSGNSVIRATDLNLNAQRDLYLSDTRSEGALSLNAGRNMQLSGTVSGAELSLRSDTGAVSQSVGSTLSVSGATVLTAGSGAQLQLNNANQFTGGITVRGAGTVAVTDVDTLSVVLDNAGTAKLTAAGALSVSGSSTGTLSATAQTLTVDVASALDLGTVSVSSLNVTAAGAVTDSGVLTVSGASQFTAAGQSVMLDSANDFGGAVSVTANSLTLNDVNTLDLGTVNATTLSVTAAGAVTDSGVLTVSGASQFTAASQSITLDSANDFGGAVSVTANSLTLNDVNTLDLGTVNVSSLNVTAAGAVTDSGVLTVSGSSQFTAAGQSITLDSANDFGGAVSVTAGGLNLTSATDLQLGMVDVGVLSLDALAGVMRQEQGASLSVSGATVLTAGSGAQLQLNNANQFTGGITVRGAGTVAVSDVDALSVLLDNAGTAKLTAAGALSVSGSSTGTLSATAQTLTVDVASALDLGTVSVSSLSVTAAGAVTDSGVLTVSGESRFSAAGQSVTLDSANDFGGVVSVDAAQLALKDASDLEVRLLSSMPVFIQLTAVSDVSLSSLGDIQFVAGTKLQSENGHVAIQASGNIQVSGVNLTARSSVLNAGLAIQALAQENAPILAFTGDLHLEARTGIGGFGFERLLLDGQGAGTSVSAYNASSGDVVIAGVHGLSVGVQGITSDADGWIALLSGRGTIQEQGEVVARSQNVVRLTGANWMARSDDKASALLADILKSGVFVSTDSSPLDRLNAMLAKNWSSVDQRVNEPPVISTAAQTLTSSSGSGSIAPVIDDASWQFRSGMSVSVLDSPKTTGQLLQMAMAISQQGGLTSMMDTESLTQWVQRSERQAQPEAPKSPSDAATPSVPAQSVPSVGSVGGSDESKSDVRSDESKPKEQTDPILERPDALPMEVSLQAPASDVRWLLPLDSLPSSVTQPVAQPATTGLWGDFRTSVKGAASALGLWLGLDSASSQAHSPADTHSQSAVSKGDEVS